MPTPDALPDAAFRIFTVPEVAEKMGVSKQSVYRMIYRDGLPTLRIARGGIRIRESHLAAWLDSLSHAPDGQVAA